MADNLKKVGADGERVARAHLESLGWRIIACNFRCPEGEMDIVAEEPRPDGDILVFVEVKTRRGVAHGTPIEAVDPRKFDRLGRIALAFLGARGAGGAEPPCRFDIAEVQSDRKSLFTVRLYSGIQAGG